MKMRSLFVVVAFVAAAAACGGRQNKAEPAPVRPVSPEPVAEPITDKLSDAQEEELIAAFEVLADEICACNDQACLEAVVQAGGEKMRKWEGLKPSPAGLQRLQEIMMRMGECIEKLEADT